MEPYDELTLSSEEGQELPRQNFSDRYVLEEMIGRGGAGVVHLAYDRILKRRVAVKRLHKASGATSAMMHEQLLLEAEAMCRIQHPNVVSVFDVGIDEDGFYIVMEYIDGFDFDSLAKDGRLMPEQFRELVIQSLDGLIAAHQLNMLHLDIKPGNLMLLWLPSGRLHMKIVDFGLARLNARIGAPTQSTRNLSIQGSIHFMSPEQFNNEELDGRSDLYSLGCLFYYALTGKYPFDGNSTIQVMASHLQDIPTPLSKLRPDLPRAMGDWVMSLMKRDPDSRPTDSLEALDQFLARKGAFWYVCV